MSVDFVKLGPVGTAAGSVTMALCSRPSDVRWLRFAGALLDAIISMEGAESMDQQSVENARALRSVVDDALQVDDEGARGRLVIIRMFEVLSGFTADDPDYWDHLGEYASPEIVAAAKDALATAAALKKS